MHISKVDLNLFVVFDAIYAEGSISRASHRLNLTQPAVSHALARLRRMFNDPLFVRQHHTMLPTPLARQIIGMTRQSLSGLETTLNQVNRFDPATTAKKFTIGLRSNLEASILAHLASSISGALAPDIQIAAIHVDRSALEREISSGTLDAAVDGLLPVSDSIRCQRVLTERLVVIARRDHAVIGDELDADTYLQLEHIAVSARRSGPAFEDFELQRLGIERRIRMRCQNYATACRVVSRSNLILTLSEYAAFALNDLYGNKALACPFQLRAYDSYLYWHINAENDPANAWLRQQMLNAAARATEETHA
ncbi:MAG: LysR family transcriptional regulator [Beijerinckiaceae bacterium]